MPDIYPTHTCFDDALDFIARMLKKGGQSPPDLAKKYRVVHGLYRVDQVLYCEKKVIAHAWVLDREHNEAIQDGYLKEERVTYSIAIEEFRKLFNTIHETIYTLHEVAKLNAKHNNYGPWDRIYLKHCRHSE